VARYEERKIRIGKAEKSARRHALERVSDDEGRRKYGIQKGLLDTERGRIEALKQNEATLADFERVFGRDDGKNHFQIGQPIDMDVPVCLDLRRFVERSNGIFGKSGTGKSFLTRLILCGVIKAGAAVNLIFDMHSEYGWSAKNEEGTEVKGLSQLFGSRVAVYTLDMESSRGRGVKPSGEMGGGTTACCSFRPATRTW